MLNKLKKLPKFFKEVREELKKVSWSSRRELIAATIIVIIVCIILTSYIAVVDLGLSRLIQILLK
ncbi:MAG: preprotein translocase subunit SecE [Candidatus Omnitrophica bacterium]|jgi:preprotein translocase subunit SecE|nr:preprotein translocase subunit SecE [Candidatus Omnitrophota bacterium]